MAAQRPGRRSFSQWSEIGALAVADQVDDWLRIELDGTVTVFSGKVELGTGVKTALAQIVAEELDVEFDQVHMVMGDTGAVPDEGITAGSTTLQIGGFALRKAAAEARLALLEMASDRLDALVDELAVEGGVVQVAADPVRSLTYAELIGGRKFNRRINLETRVKPPGDYRVVGQPLPRLDLPAKVTGQAGYVHDIRLPGMWHARLVRPPSPGAHFVSVDASSVHGAEVIRIGDFLAVAAEHEHDAVQAAEALVAAWQEPPPRPGMNELAGFIQASPTRVQTTLEAGEPDAVLETRGRRLAATYTQPFQAHASIGPSCAVADIRPDGGTVWSSTQGPYPLREALADLLGLPEEGLRVVYAEGSGSYGHNGADDATADAAVLSRELGRPVRVQWSRRDEFLWEPYAPAMVMALAAALDSDGRLLAWTHDVWSPTHGNRPRAASQLLAGQLAYGLVPPAVEWFGGGDRNAPVDYQIPNQRVTAHWLPALPFRTSSMRTLGSMANVFANESFLDESAGAAGSDPLEFRLNHLTDERASQVLTVAAEAAGWGAPLPANSGRGLAFARYDNDAAYVATVAQVHVDPATGRVKVNSLTTALDCGLIVNPDGLRNQAEGNLVQSLSRAMLEQITFDSHRITSADWDSYPILKFSDLPEIEVILINRPDQPLAGAGEPTTVCTAPAVANAIFAACGARVRDIPLSPERVLAALGRGHA
jgi:nicotinate dehydrogenase subunit B